MMKVGCYMARKCPSPHYSWHLVMVLLIWNFPSQLIFFVSPSSSFHHVCPSYRCYKALHTVYYAFIGGFFACGNAYQLYLKGEMSNLILASIRITGFGFSSCTMNLMSNIVLIGSRKWIL